MDFDFYPCGVDEKKPLLYLWQIEDAQGGVLYRYVGKANGGSKRPLTQYLRNVRNLQAGKPYRKGKPDAFREVHRKLADAAVRGYRLSLHLLENVAQIESIYDVESSAQRQYCTPPYCDLPANRSAK
ncbi:hypothetical protein [Pseudomonas fluorescens]|uniref:GIY-YIG domain-containing protein n=1 Tax=Pseudomonas fluorescens TaxID=294 RepID=A0A5E7E561_PSEFL|nr:hypothetical protein [Pseudomonas fluorescens]VVO21805.1 hypothetical protein PS723_04271 [Pseudomonas fluorescens]